MRRKKIEINPGATQLYRHFNVKGDLLYIGISLSAIARLGQHQKGASWVSEIATMSVENFPTRDQALKAEAFAINTEMPKYNVDIPPVAGEAVKRHKVRSAPSARRWVSDRYLAEYYEVSRITIWAWAKSGNLPRPRKLGENTTRWDFHEILEAEPA